MEKKIYFTPIRRFVSFLELQKHNSIVTQNNFIIYFIILLFTTFDIQSSLWTIVVSQFYCLLLSIFSQLMDILVSIIARIFKKIRENYIQFPIIQFVYTLHRHNTHKIKYNGTQVLARFLVFVFWVRASVCIPVTSMVFYLSTGLAGCLMDPRISCGAFKLARTSRFKKKIQ